MANDASGQGGPLKKRFGFWTLSGLVIANMIGAGVFTTSGYALADLRSPWLVVLAWAVGGVVALAGAVSYGLLVRAMPESGGEYLFLSRAVHPLWGFLAGWVSLIAGFSGAIAFAATALEQYALPGASRPDWLPRGAVAIASILVAGGLHGLRPSAGAVIQNAVVVVKLCLLGWIVAAGFAWLPADAWAAASLADAELSGWPLAATFAGSLVWISLSYSGFNAAAYVAGEVEGAEKIVPRALVAGSTVVVVLYVLLNTIFVYAPASEAIAGRADVAAIAAEAIGGDGLALFVRWTIVICLLTSVLSMMMASPRVYAKMADDGLLPRFLRFHGDRPQAAATLQVVLSVVLVLVSTLQGLLSYLGLTLSISAACSVATLFLPSVRTYQHWHPALLVAAVYVLSTLLAAGMMVVNDPWQIVGTALTFAVGAGVYLLARRGRP